MIQNEYVGKLLAEKGTETKLVLSFQTVHAILRLHEISQV